MSETDATVRRLRLLLGGLVFWDFAIGSYAVFFAKHMQELIRFAPQSEPLFIRGVGVYWLFAAYFQFLAFRDPRKNVLAVHLAVVFRISAAVIDVIEVLFLLQRPFYFFHYLLLFFVVMNLVIAFFICRFSGQMGLDWKRG